MRGLLSRECAGTRAFCRRGAVVTTCRATIRRIYTPGGRLMTLSDGGAFVALRVTKTRRSLTTDPCSLFPIPCSLTPVPCPYTVLPHMAVVGRRHVGERQRRPFPEQSRRSLAGGVQFLHVKGVPAGAQ